MKKVDHRAVIQVLFCIIGLFIIILIHTECHAGITFTSGYWSTSFDTCSQDETLSSVGSSVACTEGMEFLVGGTDGAGCGSNETELIAAANYSSGEGGRGMRRYWGTTSGNMSAYNTINVEGTEIWIRWYVKYSTTTWHPYTKVFYAWGDSTGSIKLNWSSDGSYYIGLENGWSGSASGSATNSMIDGSWHCFEMYLNNDGSNVDVRVWTDSTLSIEELNVGSSSSTDWGDIHVYQSFSSGAPASCATTDFDDFAAATPSYGSFVQDGSANDRIGVLGGSDTTAPVISAGAPTSQQTCTSDPRNVTISWTTDENATCKWDTSDTTYALMSNTASTTGGTSHSHSPSQACGATYDIYVRCQDSVPNTNITSHHFQYSIAAAAGTGVTISPAGAGSLGVDPAGAGSSAVSP